MPGRGYLILHGLSNHRPPGHWHRWLAEELESRGELVRYPQLPDPDEPAREAWEQAVLDELSVLGEQGATPIVVCHSLGATTWLSVGTRVPSAQRAQRSLLVAPPAPSELESLAPGFVELPPRREALRATGAATVIGSDSDPYDPPGAKATWGWLEVPIRIVHGAGHFRPDDGYGPWPDVLDWCLASA